jgi:hypothetical protein
MNPIFKVLLRFAGAAAVTFFLFIGLAVLLLALNARGIISDTMMELAALPAGIVWICVSTFFWLRIFKIKLGTDAEPNNRPTDPPNKV